MQIHVLGVAAIIFFYVLILAVGIWAGRKSKGQVNSEEVMLAGRNIGLIVSIFTMTGELSQHVTYDCYAKQLRYLIT